MRPVLFAGGIRSLVSTRADAGGLTRRNLSNPLFDGRKTSLRCLECDNLGVQGRGVVLVWSSRSEIHKERKIITTF